MPGSGGGGRGACCAQAKPTSKPASELAEGLSFYSRELVTGKCGQEGWGGWSGWAGWADAWVGSEIGFELLEAHPRIKEGDVKNDPGPENPRHRVDGGGGVGRLFGCVGAARVGERAIFNQPVIFFFPSRLE